VTTRERAASAQAELQRRCSAGLDVAGLQREVLRSVRRVLPVDAAFFATADPATLLFTGAYAEPPLDGATALFLDNELAGADVNTFPGLAASARPVATLDGATRDDRSASPRYRDIMRPLGLGDELRAALRTGADCWGYLCLHREDGAHGFTAAEVTAVARLSPSIAQVLRHAVLLWEPAHPAASPEPGVLVLTDALDVVAATPEAERLLSLVAGPVTGPGGLPLAVSAVAAALRVPDKGVPRVRLPLAPGGWLDVHAARLRGPAGQDRISVVLQPARPGDTVPLLLSARGLGRREAEVARLVLRGTPTQGIVDALHISRYTVQDHLKAVYEKVGVSSRGELVAKMFADHYHDGLADAVHGAADAPALAAA
jgi:DNA-binding CsgD family transcriptional regulator